MPMRLPDIDDDTLSKVVASLSWKERSATAQSCTRLRHVVSLYDARRPWKLLRRSDEFIERGYGPPREQLLAHAFTGLASDNIAKQHLWVLVYVVSASEDETLGERTEIRVYDLEEDAKLIGSVVLTAEDPSELPDPYDSDCSHGRRTKIVPDLLRPAEPDDGIFNCVCSTPGGYWSVRFHMGRVCCTVPATAEQRRLGIDSEDITNECDKSAADLEVLPYRSPKTAGEHGWLVRRTGTYSSEFPHLFYRKDTNSGFLHCELRSGLRTHRYDPYGGDEGAPYHFDGVETEYMSVNGYVLAHPVGENRLGTVSARRNGFAPVGNRARASRQPSCIMLQDSSGGNWLIVADARAAIGAHVGWYNCLEAWEPSALGKVSARPAFALDSAGFTIPATQGTQMRIVLASARLAIICKDGVPVCMLRIHQRGFVATSLDVSPTVPPAVRSMARGDYGFFDDPRVVCFVSNGVAHFWAVYVPLERSPMALHWSLVVSPDADLNVDATAHKVIYDDRPVCIDLREDGSTRTPTPTLKAAMLLDASRTGVLTLECMRHGAWGAYEFEGIMQFH